MKYIEWVDNLKLTISTQKKSMISKAEFKNILEKLVDKKSPISEIEYKICIGDLSESIKAGEPENDQQKLTQQPLKNPPNSSLNFRRRNQSTMDDEYVGADLPALLVNLFDSYWKAHIRDAPTNLPNMKQHDVKEMTSLFIGRNLNQNLTIGFAFFDGDDFGAINKKFSQQVGDQIIKQIGKVFSEISSISNCLAVHDGGDEFALVAAVKHPQEFVDLILQAYQRIKNTRFDLKQDVKITFSAGIMIQHDDGALHSYDELFEKAEGASKLSVNGEPEKKTSTISLFESTNSPKADLKNALLDARVSLAKSYPFVNTWMNSLSKIVKDALNSGKEVSAELNEALNDLKIECSSDLRTKRLTKGDILLGNKDLSPVDVSIAIYHGIAQHLIIKNEGANTIRLTSSANSAKIVGEEICVTLPPKFTTIAEGEIVLGIVPELADELDQQDLDSALRIAVLVHIGERSEELLALPFEECIFVDDRPTKGGELPDFWENAISQLFDIVERNPNIYRVYCSGQKSHAKKTVSILESIQSNNVNIIEIAGHLGLSESVVTAYCSKLTGTILFSSTLDEILADYLSVTEKIRKLDPLRKDKKAEGSHLIRALKSEKYAIGIQEGIQTSSIAEAFPLALDIVRNIPIEFIVNDHYGQELLELTDFKIVLDKPSLIGIPGYHKKKDLKEYYDRAFGIDPPGLFRRKIANQIDSFLKELQACISNTPVYTSRRAILIVPNQIGRDNLEPLGLVFIRGSIVVIDDAVSLRFGFYWRTVEALVGLPYSLYASLRFALHLRKMLEKRCNRSFNISRLTYIASSLHISTNPSTLSIAKRIVDMASK